MDCEIEDIMERLNTITWMDYAPVEQGSQVATLLSMIADLVNRISQTGKGRQFLPVVIAQEPTRYAALAHLPGLSIYGATAQERDYMLAQLYEASSLLPDIRYVIITIGVNAPVVSSIIDRGKQVSFLICQLGVRHAAQINTMGLVAASTVT